MCLKSKISIDLSHIFATRTILRSMELSKTTLVVETLLVLAVTFSHDHALWHGTQSRRATLKFASALCNDCNKVHPEFATEKTDRNL